MAARGIALARAELRPPRQPALAFARAGPYSCPPMQPLLRLLRLHDATAAERRAALWTAVAFFCVLFSYYLLRPLRENVGAAFGPERLLPLFALTFAFVTLLNQPYVALVRRLPSHRFLPYALHAFAASFVALALVQGGGDGKLGELDFGSARGVAHAIFYAWVSAFAVGGVTLVWVHAVEWFSLAQGKRLFGLIGVGGTLGAMAGSSASFHLREASYAQLLLMAAVGVECAIGAWRLSLAACRRMDRAPRAHQLAEAPTFLQGLARVLRDPYLRGFAGFVLLAAVVGTTFYFQRITLTKAQMPDEAARRALEAGANWWYNAICLVLQLFVTSRVLMVLGVGAALCAMPLASFAGLAALAVWPLASLTAVVEVARRTLQFAFDKPARDVLYTPLDQEAKYVSKAVVDTSVLRFGDLLGAFANEGLRMLQLSNAGLCAVALPFVLLWAWLGRQLGRRCRQYEQAQRASTS
jgi:AAA family ATP:ADP antiporter